MGRHSCCIKQKLRKGLWSPEEDEKLYNYITRFGVGCWSTVPKLAGLQRCGKSCRLRWINYLRPNLKRGMFSQQEEDLIIRLHEVLGNRWAQIAAQLPGRTDNEIKNFWNSCLKKKLLKQGIDPNTHQPVIENIELEELTKDHHQHQQQQQLQQQQSTKCSNNNNHGISHSSSTTTSSSSAGYNNGHSQHRQYMNNNSNNNNNNNIKHVVYDPFFLLDFQTNILADDPSGYNSSGCNFLNLNQYCQQSTTIRPPPPHPQQTAATSGFETFPNNNNGFMMINNNSSLPNLTNLDQESVMNNNNRMMGNGGGVSWDLENKLVESVNYLQFINGIQIEEDVKKQPLLLPPRPPPCPWDESHRGIVIDESSNQNSGDLMISNYPLTSLSAEDFCGANLDPVFTHI